MRPPASPFSCPAGEEPGMRVRHRIVKDVFAVATSPEVDVTCTLTWIAAPIGSGGTCAEHAAFPVASTVAVQVVGFPGKKKDTSTEAPIGGCPFNSACTRIVALPPMANVGFCGIICTTNPVWVGADVGAGVLVGTAVGMMMVVLVTRGGKIAATVGMGVAVGISVGSGVEVGTGVLLGRGVAVGLRWSRALSSRA